jgi:hypothetical protein
LPELAEKLDSGIIGLEDYIGFFWQFCPSRMEHTKFFLEGMIQAKREGRPYTQDDFRKFKKQCTGGRDRQLVLKKLEYLGVVEKRNKTVQKYEIIFIDKWIERLNYLAENWQKIIR